MLVERVVEAIVLSTFMSLIFMNGVFNIKDHFFPFFGFFLRQLFCVLLYLQFFYA